MRAPVDTARPSAKVCARARLSRDPRFDGLFYTAVKTTGIYCRPVCPARPPKESNVVYLFSAAECETQGFRPCLRCRPELAPGRTPGDLAMERALGQVESGYLQSNSMDALASAMDLSPRQLSRRFVQAFGATPTQIHATQRLLFARQLLLDSNLPITQVAYAAGFSSLRRFNDAFSKAYQTPPRSLRKGTAKRAHALSLRLCYRPPFDFAHTLAWLESRLIQGVEAIEDGAYLRLLDTPEDQAPAWVRVAPSRDAKHALELQAHNVPPQRLRAVLRTVRRVFDLDAHPQAIAAALGKDPRLKPLLQRWPGLRIPGAWDGFETAMRAVIGQQVSVAAAHTITQRVMQRVARPLQDPPHPALTLQGPSITSVLDADLSGVGLTQRRIDSIFAVGRALLHDRVSLHGNQNLDDWVASWTALPGIGPWTASYLALRVLGHPDAFPGGDLVLRKTLTAPGEPMPTPSRARAMAETWRPWRSYAAFYLWRAATQAP